MIEIGLEGVSHGLLYALILVRDKECRNEKLTGIKCGVRHGLEVHHIIGRDKPNSNNPENLIALCGNHHRAIRSHDGTKQILLAKKLIIDNGLSVSGLAPLIGLTQPALSIMLQKPPLSLKRIIQFKNILNSILNTSYSIDELFQNIETSEDQYRYNL